MDLAQFFATIRAAPFAGSLSQEAVDGVSAILAAFQVYGDGDRGKLAYILATAFHEGDRFRTMREYASGEAYEGRRDLGNTTAGDGRRFRGRGFVQITGRRNYTDWAKRLGVDLVGNPDLAEQRPIAARILVEGMMLGTFTGRKLGDYVAGTKVDYREARRVVNGTDKAELIAGHARQFEVALDGAGYDGASAGAVPETPAVVIVPPAQTPVPIGHNGGPPLEPEPVAKPTPTGGPVSKANGGAIGVIVVSPLLGLMAKFGWIPASIATDPEVLIQVTALLLAAGAWAGTYLAPRNAETRP
ncbi:glycoside hydrolase family 19 protein [Antarcticirhabdus aurantiaca]|uniref:Uncharacterized protein n=1 Tax=Antarcticirhabdus aurantiaca TaxID=2606717 RepID=A0ACD4NJU9_9HYPH|nr:glycoside hydrolase family 19 protein [Antarcticirhabdus aurantiaca]WAJ27130.1 hypothetical protein OXU80_20070 [Jeongeuplla avenae]